MADGGELTREQMLRFIEEIKGPQREHEQEKRRGLQIGAGFFEKLAALNAGSFAIAASIILAVVLKSSPAVHPEVSRIVVREILKTVALFWASLVLAILHNFLAAFVAQLEAKSSETEFIVTLLRRTLSLTRENMPLDDATAAQAEDMMLEQLRPTRQRLATSIHKLYPVANIVGYASLLLFLTAYTLVMFYLWKLW